MLLLKKMFGQPPFCSSASISVPGAPASSLVTVSQLEVSNPGAEICAPVWVAVALLSTFQPVVPRLEMSVAPLSLGEPAGAAGTRPELAELARWIGTALDEGAAWAPDAETRQASTSANDADPAHSADLR